MTSFSQLHLSRNFGSKSVNMSFVRHKTFISLCFDCLLCKYVIDPVVHELVYGKLQTLFSFTCDLMIGFFTQAQWEVHVLDNLNQNSRNFRVELPMGHFTVVYLVVKGT